MLESVMSVLVAVIVTSVPLKVMALAKLIAAAEILPSKVFVPRPVCVKVLVAVISPVLLVVKTPPLATATLPPVTKAAFRVRLLPVKAKLLAKLTAPLSVVVPVPTLWVKLVASIVLAAMTLRAVVIVTASSATNVLPSLLPKLISLAADKLKLWA